MGKKIILDVNAAPPKYRDAGRHDIGLLAVFLYFRIRPTARCVTSPVRYCRRSFTAVARSSSGGFAMPYVLPVL